ncbi:MAG TPA: hypothetical protein DCY25_01110 [Bacteroidales bacterium]|nr:hypothetical protein [Bacteroidales bacterium]
MKPTQKSIVSSRTEYISDGLDEKTLSGNPLDLFEKWMAEAERKIAGTPNATFLATAGKDGRPSGRIEFWQGRAHRLHDRILYSRKDFSKEWIAERLYP